MKKEKLDKEQLKKNIEEEKAKIKELNKKSLKKAGGFFHDFKQFATKGNVIDMAVGVVIATAFTAIVNSLVNDIITPAISIFTGKVDFSNLFVALDGNTYQTLAEAKEKGVSVINYGTFITNIIDFLLVAFCLFIVLKLIFRLKNVKKKTEEAPTTKKCPYCLSDIPIEATRCAHCTSMLEEPTVKE